MLEISAQDTVTDCKNKEHNYSDSGIILRSLVVGLGRSSLDRIVFTMDRTAYRCGSTFLLYLKFAELLVWKFRI